MAPATTICMIILCVQGKVSFNSLVNIIGIYGDIKSFRRPKEQLITVSDILIIDLDAATAVAEGATPCVHDCARAMLVFSGCDYLEYTFTHIDDENKSMLGKGISFFFRRFTENR